MFNENYEYLLTPFFYPTQTIFVDDDKAFIETFPLEVSIKNNQENYQLFTSAYDAINYVHQYDNMPFFSPILAGRFKDGFEKSPSEFCLDRKFIFNQLSKSQRFKEIASAVIDYSMPEMDGITFCKKLNKKTKRIILTGMGDQQSAIEAFNAKLISKYVTKSATDTTAKIAHLILQYQQDYFIDICYCINKFLGKKHFLNDKNIVTSFKHLCHQHGIIEYYLIHPTHLLCLDKNGNHSLFIAETFASLAKHYQIAADRNAPEALIDELASASTVPYFPTFDQFYDNSLIDWQNCFHEKYTIIGHEKYFCTFLESPFIPGFNSDSVVSFNDFLNNEYGVVEAMRCASL